MKIAPTVSQQYTPSKSLFAAKKPTNTSLPNPAASAADGTLPVAQGGPALSQPPQIDFQQFFAAWGTSNAKFDVTKDGTVDAQDLAVFLGNAPPQSQATAQNVLDSWGKSGGAGDINGDGTVDAADLALALGNVQPNSTDSMVAGVQQAWGTADKAYDLNQDGTVDGADLGLALAGGQAPATPKPTPDALASKIADAVFAARDVNQDDALALDELPVVASKLAARVDADRDGMIGKAELRTQLTAELSKMQTQRPEADLGQVADRWLSAFLGKTDPRVMAARNAYGNSQMLDSLGAVNSQA